MEHISELSTLSWLIYISSLNLGNVVVFLLFLTLISLVFSGFLLSEPAIDEKGRGFGSLLIKISGAFFGLALLVGILVVLIPDRQTIITIAAIEIGEDTQMLKRVEGLLDTFMPLNEGE